MEILHQYYYRKGMSAFKSVGYTILAVIFVVFGVYSFIHWELSFLFSDWYGYVVLILYGLITQALVITSFQSFKQATKARHDIPAFAVGADFFVFYDKNGLATQIPFADCEQVEFKSSWQFRVPIPKLVIKYHEKKDPENTIHFELGLNELNHPVDEVEEQVNKVYQKYKKEHPDQ